MGEGRRQRPRVGALWKRSSYTRNSFRAQRQSPKCHLRFVISWFPKSGSVSAGSLVPKGSRARAPDSPQAGKVRPSWDCQAEHIRLPEGAASVWVFCDPCHLPGGLCTCGLILDVYPAWPVLPAPRHPTPAWVPSVITSLHAGGPHAQGM